MDARLLTEKRNVAEMGFEGRRKLLTDITQRCLRLISRRAQYKTNPVIYEKNTLGEKYKDLSLLEYAIIEKEKYYMKMGRYRHETQYPITLEEEIEGPFYGVDQKKQTFKTRIEIPNLIEFYKGIVNNFCEQGEDSGRACLIADLDVDCIDEIHSRLQFGRYIIDGKIGSNSDIKELLDKYSPDKRKDVLGYIVFKEQEQKVVDSAIDYSKSKNLGLSTENVSSLIKDFIKLNTKVQFQYLKTVYNVDLEAK